MDGGRLESTLTTPVDRSNILRTDFAYLRSLPTDPKALLALLDKQSGQASHGRDAAVFSTIQVLMRGSVLPPRLRAALHGALAAIPGVHFAKDVTDAAGRHGVALYGNDLAFCARRQVTTDPVPLRMIRSSRCPLSIIDLTYAYSFCHQDSLAVTRPKTTIRTACHATTGKRCLMRHDTWFIRCLGPFVFITVGLAP